MTNIYECAQAFIPLLDTEYHIILGRKNKTVELIIYFDKTHFYHLFGLQYLTDLADLNKRRDIIFNELVSGKLGREKIESSDLYYKIEERIKFLPYLEQIIDSNQTVFRYNKNQNLYSMIQADYLMKNTMLNSNTLLFLSKNQNEKYFCRSFFPENKRDYTKNQSLWTLLYKKKINLKTGKESILYNCLKDKDI
ncbi:MAG: PBECR4 domain-containing protein [Eubacteriales bacterium]